MKYIYSWCSFNATRLPDQNYTAMAECTVSSLKSFAESADKLVFYTDEQGKAAFNDILTYFDEVVVIDKFGENFSNKFYYYEKYYVASLQNEPFIHLDFEMLFIEKPEFDDAHDIIAYDAFGSSFENSDTFMFFDDKENTETINIAIEILGTYSNFDIFKTMIEFVDNNCTKDKIEEFDCYKQDAVSMYMKRVCRENDYSIYYMRYFTKIDNLKNIQQLLN